MFFEGVMKYRDSNKQNKAEKQTNTKNNNSWRMLLLSNQGASYSSKT